MSKRTIGKIIEWQGNRGIIMSPEYGDTWFFVRSYLLEPPGFDIDVKVGEDIAFRWIEENNKRIAFDVLRLSHLRPKIFLTHSSLDKPLIRELRNYLLKCELNVWLDEIEIQVGDSIVQKVTEGLSQTDFLVVALSQNALDSKWVKREINSTLMANLSGRKVTILPLLLEKCEIPILLNDIYYADSTISKTKGFEDLVNAIKSKRYDL
jgi:TIR domain